MSISSEGIFGSAPFRFIVGPDRKPFTIHTDVVAFHSAPLGLLMKGQMREAQDGFAELSDVDERTFDRFCEYAYIGDYTAPQYESISSSIVAGENIPPQDQVCSDTVDPLPTDGEISFEHYGKKKKKRSGDSVWGPVTKPPVLGSRKQEFFKEFQRRQYPAPIAKFQPPKNPIKCKDSAEDFLCNARIYVFAEKYDIAKLRTLALHKLHQTLKTFKVSNEEVGNIISLVQYSYNNDNTRDNEPGQEIDSLRNLVVHYVACEFETVAKDDRFLAMLEEGGPLVRDFTCMLLKRID